jgi:AraC-like DNA-binding protein
MRHRLELSETGKTIEFELEEWNLGGGGLVLEVPGPGWLLVAHGRLELGAGRRRLAVRASEVWKVPGGMPLRLAGLADSRGWLLGIPEDTWEILAESALGGRWVTAGRLPSAGSTAEMSFPMDHGTLVVVEASLRRLGAEAIAGGAGAAELSGALLVEIAVRLGRLAPPASEVPLVWTVAELARHLERHHANHFTLDELVARCALNTSDFCRQFKAATGYPVFEYLNRQRIARACQLLRRSDLTVTEVAQMVGYRNVSFFNRYFARITGTNPTSYRNAR